MAIQFGKDFRQLPFVKYCHEAVTMTVYSDHKDRDWKPENVKEWITKSTWDPIRTEFTKWRILHINMLEPFSSSSMHWIDAELLPRWHRNVGKIQMYVTETTLRPLFIVWSNLPGGHHTHSSTAPPKTDPREVYDLLLAKMTLTMPPSVIRFVKSWNIAARMCDKYITGSGGNLPLIELLGQYYITSYNSLIIHLPSTGSAPPSRPQYLFCCSS